VQKKRYLAFNSMCKSRDKKEETPLQKPAYPKMASWIFETEVRGVIKYQFISSLNLIVKAIACIKIFVSALYLWIVIIVFIQFTNLWWEMLWTRLGWTKQRWGASPAETKQIPIDSFHGTCQWYFRYLSFKPIKLIQWYHGGHLFKHY